MCCYLLYRSKLGHQLVSFHIVMVYLLVLLLANTAAALPATSKNIRYPRSIFGRDGPSIEATDPWDRRWIEQLTAVGDSYSVGLGAGHAVKANSRVTVFDAIVERSLADQPLPQMELNADCYQYSYGFPNLVNMDDMMAENNQRHFQYLGCSGALTGAIKDKQVPKMQLSQAVVLSAGGNDAHLATILNYCVYQWSSSWPWSCDGELDKAVNEVKSDGYFKGMTDMLTAIEGKLIGVNSRIYWAGYMRFFDTSTNECDGVTWAFSTRYFFREYLRQPRRYAISIRQEVVSEGKLISCRIRFNELTDLVNQKIQDACRTIDRCVYVDSEPSVEQNQGRYCMPGINENYYGGIDSPVDGWNRERTVFYEW